ncbi:Probable carboxylesterase 7 [Linum grandiflorum]
MGRVPRRRTRCRRVAKRARRFREGVPGRRQRRGEHRSQRGDEEWWGGKADRPTRGCAYGLWLLAYPGSVGGLDDPKINATINPKLPGLGCKRVLVMVAEKDMLKDRGWSYYEAMGKNGWKGTVEIEETKGEGHVFHLFNPASDSAAERLKRTVLFLNREGTL